MKYYSFSQQGQRSYQEDYWYANPASGLYIVCDGVGGAAKGDEASKLVTNTLRELIEDKGIKPTGKAIIHQLISSVETALKNRVKLNPEEEGMGTTLTMAYFHQEGLTLAHIGDSRIYLIKPKQDKYWRSKDHSLVQELYDSGVLKNESDMETHPMRNRITRALQGKTDAKPVKADVLVIDKLESGDIIMLCSDGVLEPYSGDNIVSLLSDSENDLATKLDWIKSDCAEKSSDNNTCILMELDSSEEILAGTNEAVQWRKISGAIPATDSSLNTISGNLPENNTSNKTEGNFSKLFLRVAMITFLALMIGGYFIYSGGDDTVDSDNSTAMLEEKPEDKKEQT